jgi:Mediator of RNA pol II transcription subunit 19
MFNNNFQNSSSPKSSSSSPRRVQDSSGTLKTKISLGKNPTIVHSGPFYLVKEAPEKSDLTGATNLISHYGLEHTFNKFNSKKVKEQLSSFLPSLPCVIDGPGTIVSRQSHSVNTQTHEIFLAGQFLSQKFDRQAAYRWQRTGASHSCATFWLPLEPQHAGEFSDKSSL